MGDTSETVWSKTVVNIIFTKTYWSKSVTIFQIVKTSLDRPFPENCEFESYFKSLWYLCNPNLKNNIKYILTFRESNQPLLKNLINSTICNTCCSHSHTSLTFSVQHISVVIIHLVQSQKNEKLKIFRKTLRTYKMNDRVSYALLLPMLPNMITFGTASVECKWKYKVRGSFNWPHHLQEKYLKRKRSLVKIIIIFSNLIKYFCWPPKKHVIKNKDKSLH